MTDAFGHPTCCALCDGRDPRFPISEFADPNWNWTCAHHTKLLIDLLRTQGRTGLELVELIDPDHAADVRRTNEAFHISSQASRLHPDPPGQSATTTTPGRPITGNHRRTPSGNEYQCGVYVYRGVNPKRAGEDEGTPGAS